MILINSTFVEMVTHLMLAHVCATPIEPTRRVLAFLMVLFPICSVLSEVAGDSFEEFENQLLLIMSIVSAYVTASMFYQVSNIQ